MWLICYQGINSTTSLSKPGYACIFDSQKVLIGLCTVKHKGEKWMQKVNITDKLNKNTEKNLSFLLSKKVPDWNGIFEIKMNQKFRLALATGLEIERSHYMFFLANNTKVCLFPKYKIVNWNSRGIKPAPFYF